VYGLSAKTYDRNREIMDISWRTVQFFLDDEGVAEVEVDQDSGAKVRCDCLQFGRMARCKHSKYVKEAMAENEGHYALEIPVHVDDEEALVAMVDATAFRTFVMKYGKVVVLE
jgi:hypothetical protein